MEPKPPRIPASFRRSLGRFASDYGMLGVLLLLCLYYSFATLSEQTPRGPEAARTVLSDALEAAGPGKSLLIVTKDNPVDVQFAEDLRQELSARGRDVQPPIQGDPAQIRSFFESVSDSSRQVTAVVTTRDYAAVVSNVAGRVPGMAEALIVAPGSYRWPTFLLADNVRNVANQIVVIAIIAIGMTLVIVTAGIDLSVGSLIAFSAVVTAWLIQWFGGVGASAGEMLLASLGAMAACALIGLFSGFTVTAFKIPPFIATLGIMQVASGLAYILSGGESIYDIPDSFVWLGRGADLLSIPNAVVLMALLYALAHVLMTRTTLGRYIYAVGGNPEAARLSGIRVNRILLLVYTVSGLLAGLGGVVLASQLKSGAPTYGLMYELYVIAAVVIGGTSLFGGEGRIMGTLIGAFIIGVIQNGMNLTGVESYTQKVVLGFVILGAVVLDMLKKRDWRRLLRLARPGR